MAKEVKGPEKLAAIIICENPEWFTVSEYTEAKNKLSKRDFELILEYKGRADLKRYSEHQRGLSKKKGRVCYSKWADILRKYWFKKTCRQLADMLGVSSVKTVYNYGRSIGLMNKESAGLRHK